MTDHVEYTTDAWGVYGPSHTCMACAGTGQDYGETCVVCGGEGFFCSPVSESEEQEPSEYLKWLFDETSC